MPQILLVNPTPRKGKSKMATARKKARSPAQRAATAKLVRRNKSRSAAPKRRMARPSRAPVAARRPRRAAARRPNPTRRKYKRSGVKAASAAGRTLRYRRTNPIGDFVGGVLIPSAVGGAGALSLDILIAALPLPVAMKVGPMAPFVKVAGAVGLGMLAGQLVSRKVGEQVTAGALTVIMYNVARATLARVSGGRIPGLSMYPDGPLGAYVSSDEAALLGYEDSGMQVGDNFVNADGAMSGYESGVYR